MPADEKEKLITAHKEFNRLRYLCQAKKEIEILPKMTGIKILKWTQDTLKLKDLKDFLKPGGFQWIEPKHAKKTKKHH